MIPAPWKQMGHEGARHRVAAPSRQERRVRRLLRIAGRVHRGALTVWDYELARHIELNGQQAEPNRKGLAP